LGYYIRILGKNPANLPLEQLRGSATPAVIEIDKSDGELWEQLTLRHESGQEIAAIEKNPVVEGELGAEELQEFIDEVSVHEPASAATWLQNYLPGVRVIYAFQLLSGTDANDGWSHLHRVYNTVWSLTGGILQADGEGFSNEEGFTILWQFGDSVKGAWNVGVLNDDGRWVHFEIDLGNMEHRQAFRRGEVPVGAKLL
jgi:hypothetical protein